MVVPYRLRCCHADADADDSGWVKLNRSNDTVSKGQLIFLVRRIAAMEEQSDLLTRNYIFADPTAVANTLHKTLSVPLEHTTPLLGDITLWADSTARPALKPNTLYAGVAVVQATPFDGLRILLEQSNRSQLPMRELCTFSDHSTGDGGDDEDLYGTVEEMAEAITWLEGMNLLSVITRNMALSHATTSAQRRFSTSSANSSSSSFRNFSNTHHSDSNPNEIGGPRVTKLLAALELALIPMLDETLTLEDMQYLLPRLTLHPVLVPLTPGAHIPSGRGITYTPPYLIAFYANYDAAVNTFTDKWLPFSLFRAQNACVMRGSIAAAARLEVLAGGHTPLLGNGSTSGSGSGSGGGGGIGGEGFNTGRRPSKVQFEFPAAPAGSGGGVSAATQSTTSVDNINGSSSTSTSYPAPVPAPAPAPASALPRNAPPPSTPFDDYSFPPKSSFAGGGSGAVGGVQPQQGFTFGSTPAIQASLPGPSSTSANYYAGQTTAATGYGNGNGNGIGYSSGNGNGNPPRRSSLANRSRFAPGTNNETGSGDSNSNSIYHRPSGSGSGSVLGGFGPGQATQMQMQHYGRTGEAEWDPDWLLVLLRGKLRAET